MWEEHDSTQCLGFAFMLLWEEKCLLVSNRSCFTYIQKLIYFFPLQLLVPLWSTPRLPMQRLAPHWEFAGASSQMTLLSATSCATNQWATRGTVTSKQVKEAETWGENLGPHWQKQLVPKWQSVPLQQLLCYQNVICATTAPASSFVTLFLPGLSCCQLHQDPSQEQRQDHGSSWDSRSGKEGQWMQSGPNRSISFPEGQTLQQTHTPHPLQSTVFLESKSSYYRHAHLNPHSHFTVYLNANNR